MRLTDILREQHAQLCLQLQELRRLGLADPRGRACLQRARQAMLAHLSLEDHRLYPPLHDHPATRTLARQYAAEMEQLSPALQAFFDNDHEGGADPPGFTHSLDQLLALLRQRITREEERLYPAYEAHCDKGD